MNNQYQRNKYELLKEKCLAHLGGKRCKICGISWLPICCYDFHHEKGIKENAISKMIRIKISLDMELKLELEKCCVVCANCHRQVTTKLIRVPF